MRQNISRRKYVQALATGCLAGLAGCGGGGNDSTPTNTSTNNTDSDEVDLPDPDETITTSNSLEASEPADGSDGVTGKTDGGIKWTVTSNVDGLDPSQGVTNTSSVSDDGAVKFTLAVRNSGGQETDIGAYDWELVALDSNGSQLNTGQTSTLSPSSATPPGETAELEFSGTVSDAEAVAEIQITVSCPPADFSDTVYC